MSLEPYWSDGDLSLHLGDCLDVLAEMEPESVDAVVTDAPYGLAELSAATVLQAIAAWMAGDRAHVPDGRGFMGSEWDRFVPPPGAWDACMRVLKPGGWLFTFAGTRTVDLMTLSIRIAGFEIRDSIDWIFSQGFPKGHDVSKAIDREAGAVREVVSEGAPVKRMIPGAQQNRTKSWIKDDGREFVPATTMPATAEAAEWDGWDVALKPAHEPIVVARKPLAGTIAQNVLRYGTGALNVNSCRVGAAEPLVRPAIQRADNAVFGPGLGAGVQNEPAGRWPSNILLTHSGLCEPTGLVEVRSDGHHPASRGAGGVSTSGHAGQQGLTERKSGTETVQAWDCAPGCPVAELDRQSGVLTSGANPTRRNADVFSRDIYGDFAGQRECVPHRGADSGGASRFFPVFKYEPKAPASERPRLPDGTAHMTVKPLDLMCWLVRLVSRRGALILDPFAGSGTTGEACAIEGRGCVLIERDERFAELIKVRLRKPIQPGMFDLEAS